MSRAGLRESRNRGRTEGEEQSSPKPHWALGSRVLLHGLSGCASLALGRISIFAAVLFPLLYYPPMASGTSGKRLLPHHNGGASVFSLKASCARGESVGPHRAATRLRGKLFSEMVREPEEKGPYRQRFWKQFPFT